MRNVVAIAVFAAGTATAVARPMTLQGTVIETKGRWTADRSRIITDVTIQTASGPVVVSQLGGTADGLGMITMPGPPQLEPGMVVTVNAQERADLTSRMHFALEDAKVLAVPPSFVRTGPTRAGHSLYWESGCAFVTVDSSGTSAIRGDGEFAVIDASINTWNDAPASCAYQHLFNDGKKAVEVDAKDRVNVIKFRDSSWCRPATADDPQRCYSPGSAGITTATYVNDGGERDGAIVDADIELNGVDFAIAVGGQTLAPGRRDIADLQNTLTHELGHLQGLEHTCRVMGDPPRVDHLGRSVPLCESLSDPNVTEATMYPFQTSGETKKATLETDDIDAMCSLFSKADPPPSCQPVDTGGCCSASDGPAGALTLGGLVGLALLGRRRKNRALALAEYPVAR
jgi:uncharacterized protein (TIGR03382 family)